MISMELDGLARHFWAGTGWHDTFPRPIEDAAPLRLPVAVIKQPQTNLATVRKWLQQRGLIIQLPNDERDLYGCLVAHRGHGLMFVNAAEGAAELRLTIAHEVAHFLADYLVPRRQVLHALGVHAAEVLDGLRQPTPAERAASILGHIRLGPHIHLLPRPGSAADAAKAVARAESRADQLARALVAPQARVHAALQTLSAQGIRQIDDLCAALAADFGLPAYVFNEAVQHLAQPPLRSLVDDIRAGLRKPR
jgi:Zn-dependent peptidase ImmA (M78 family)